MEYSKQNTQSEKDGDRQVFYCQNCGMKCSDNSSYCHKCGIKLIKLKLCNKCKNHSLEANIHCNFCGTLIGEEKKMKFSIHKTFSETRMALYFSIIGLAFSIFQFYSLKDFLGYLSITRIELAFLDFKNIVLFSFILTSSIYNLKVPRLPNELIILGLVGSFITTGIIGGINVIRDYFLVMIILFVVGYIFFEFIKPVQGGTVKYCIVIGTFMEFNLLTSFIVLTFVFLIPKYMLDIYVRGRDKFTTTIPYISISAFFVIFLNL